MQALLDSTVKEFGKVDILINCAGKIKREPTLTVSEETWNEIMDTNLTGTLRACQIFGRHMLDRGYGRIVNIASLNTFVSLKEITAYAASKAAVGRANQVARRGVERPWRHRQRHRPGSLPHRPQPEAPR